MSLNHLTGNPADSQQICLIVMQVYRQNCWVTLPIQNAAGNLQIGAAGTVTLTMGLDNNYPPDPRLILYEGERIRGYRGLYGSPIQRFFTGFVDAPSVTDSVQGSVRVHICSDNIKELNDAILLEPRVYDGMEPNAAVADAINQAITSGQLQLYNDDGTANLTVANYDQPNGNPILDAPTIFNDDQSVYFMPIGIYSTTATIGNASATIAVPPPSGTNDYIEVQLPFGYVIASTVSSVLGPPITNATTLPPASGTYCLDSYNGILYFNNANAGLDFTFYAAYYSTPLFGFQIGTSIGDVVSTILDKTGQILTVDANGKFHCVEAAQPRVPTRILGKDQYLQNSVQTNRDRCNVIVCEGWDGNCGGIIAAKAILYNDTILAPPQGLGKRKYLIVQDPTWTTQYAANKAAYYAAQQIGRRGKILSVTMLDDVSVQLYDIIGFRGTVPELSNGDFFTTESVNWQVGMLNNIQVGQSTVSGTLIPGQSLIYIGPGNALTASGNIDYSVDSYPILPTPYLTPNGGTTAANFSINNTGLTLTFETGPGQIYYSITAYGSDGSTLIIQSEILANPNAIYALPMPVNEMIAGVFYVFYLWTIDGNGNVGAYTDCIYALP